MGVLHKSIQGGMWLTVGYVTERIIGLLSFFILARILKPSDFGILSIVFLLPKFLQSITEPGFSAAAIQKEGNIKQYLNPIWSLRVVRSIAVAIFVAVIAPIIAEFFHITYAVNAIRISGVALLMLNLGNIGEIYFFKELDFKKIFFRNLIRQIAYISVTIGIALIAPSYWALVIGTFALNGVEAISTYILHPYRPQFTFNWKPLKDLTNYSKWIFGQGILDQLYGFIETTIVGRVTGTSAMGLYSKAKSLASVIPGFISSAVNMVSFSAYAKLKDEPDKVRDGFLKSIDLLSFIIIPAIVVVFIGGGKLILILLGAAWLPMIDPLRILMVYYALGVVLDISYRLLSGIGQPDKKVKLDILKTGLTVTLIILLTPRYSIIGTSLALLFGSVPALILILSVLKRSINLQYREFWKTILVPFMASFVIVLPLIGFKESILRSPALIIVSTLVFLSAIYFITIIALGKLYKLGPYRTIKIILHYVTNV